MKGTKVPMSEKKILYISQHVFHIHDDGDDYGGNEYGDMVMMMMMMMMMMPMMMMMMTIMMMILHISSVNILDSIS